jgi:hypothetical protein
LLHTQRFVVCELSSYACCKKASMTAITAAPGEEEARYKAPLSMIMARYCTGDCRLPSARPAIQPKYAALLIAINPLVHLFESILSGSRQTV